MKTLLEQMGSAKRRSFFKSEAVVDTVIADGLVNQMIDWAALLGAIRPQLALRMIAWMFKDKDWESSDRPNIVKFITEMQNKWNSAPLQAPHMIISPVELKKTFGNQISITNIKDDRMRIALEQYVLEGLLWGLANPEKFKAWTNQDEKEKSAKMPLMKKAGLHVDKVTQEQLLKEAEAMLGGYEAEVDPLPEIPPALLEDAKKLGIPVTQ